MKSNKDRVLEFIIEYTKDNDYVTAYQVAMHLSLQRSNVSSLLNQLVKEGLITKGNGRPVKFFLNKEETSNDFESLIGSEGSLLEAIQIIKAAVLYPSFNHFLLFKQNNGCEGSRLSELTYQFAKQAHVIKADGKYYVFDCNEYQDASTMLNDLVNSQGYLYQSQNGLLLIKNAQLLNIEQRSILFNVIDQEKIKLFIIFMINEDTNNDAYSYYQKKLNFTINIPRLKDRPISEKYQYVEQFLIKEANNINKNIKLNAGLIRCLLVYNTPDNIDQLEKDIQIGCANAYARNHNLESNSIELTILDFPNYVRKGIVNIKENLEELNRIVNDNYLYSFTLKEVLKSRNSSNQETNIYSIVENKKEELINKNFVSQEIDTIMSMDIHSEFTNYLDNITKDINSLEDLNVSDKLIQLVTEFLDNMSLVFQKNYSIKLKYGLCLFINEALNNHQQVIQKEVIYDIINNYDEQYIYAKRFVKKLEQVFNTKFGIDENVFITLFIIQDNENTNKVVTLLVMHGDDGAKSISEVVRSLTNSDSIYSLDLPLDNSYDQSYQALKNKLISINQGLGVIIIYDMGSIKTLANNVSHDLNVPLRCIECPITLMAVNSVKQCLYQTDLDNIYHSLQNEEPVENKVVDSYQDELNELFEYMSEQFEKISMDDLNNYVMPVINQIKEIYEFINEDSLIGIIIHIICLIDSLLKHQSPSININAANIIGHYPDEVNMFREMFKDIESHFNIIINDSELATIISIIKNIK